MGAERAVARILRADGGTAGLCFLVAGGRLVTCAHVVNTALGRPRKSPDRPEGTVRLRFAFDAGEVRDATVAAWCPGERWTPDGDLAVLALTGAPPEGLGGLVMAAAMPESSTRVQLCGPDGDDRVKHVVGTLLGATGRGLRQIDQSRSGAHQASAGFSGGPVWLDGSGEVVGVMRAARGGEGVDVDCLE
ncbi:MAG TPA: serine protease, partial [Phytomonospora sp.]